MLGWLFSARGNDCDEQRHQHHWEEGLAGVFARQSATGREVPGSQRLLSGLLPPLCVF